MAIYPYCPMSDSFNNNKKDSRVGKYTGDGTVRLSASTSPERLLILASFRGVLRAHYRLCERLLGEIYKLN